jgi:hypothetical protein
VLLKKFSNTFKEINSQASPPFLKEGTEGRIYPITFSTLLSHLPLSTGERV